jgi:hypothetical protein
MDKSDSKFLFLERGRDLVPRWLFVGHRLTMVIVLCMIAFTVLTLIATILVGGYSLAEWLMTSGGKLALF